MSFPPAIPAAPSDEREEDYVAPRAEPLGGVPRAAAARLAGQPPGPARARGARLRRPAHRQARHRRGADLLQGRHRPLTAAAGTGADLGDGPRDRHRHAHRRLWHRPRPDDGADAGARRHLHRGRPERRPPAQQPHVRAPAPAVAALSSGAAHGRAVARHRAGDARRRAHHPHGHPQRRADRARAAAGLRHAALLFRLALRGDHAGDGRRLHVVHVLGLASGASPSAAR